MFLKLFKITSAVSCGEPEVGEQYKTSRSDDVATITCTTSGQSWTLTCKEATWTGTVGNCTIKPPQPKGIIQILFTRKILRPCDMKIYNFYRKNWL